MKTPVEYELEGASQIQVDDASELTFSRGISTALRLDPDCILIGELRDPESVFAALTASTSGHPVISALHAKQAIDAVTVLRRWGAKNGPLASQLGIVINQRLVPNLCQACKYERLPDESEKEWLEKQGLTLMPAQVSDATGCDQCKGSGFSGRSGVVEVWQVSDADRDLIASGGLVSRLQSELETRRHRSLDKNLVDRVVAGRCKVPRNEQQI